MIHNEAADKIEIAFTLARLATSLGIQLPAEGTDLECLQAIEQALPPFMAAKACLDKADALLQQEAIANLVATSYRPGADTEARRVHLSIGVGSRKAVGGRGATLQDALAQLLTAELPGG